MNQILKIARAESKMRLRYQQYIIQQTLLANQVQVKHPEELEAESDAAHEAEEAML